MPAYVNFREMEKKEEEKLINQLKNFQKLFLNRQATLLQSSIK